ncbi:MAG: hypothetical protein L6V95_14905 [Candidatus Melainabacteria bacterium]|nr:MAG: hypothetical protein L6V95_14905 [Candidatus Melainabacteria bacterium]
MEKMRVNAGNYGNEMQVLKSNPKQKEQNPNLNQNFGKSTNSLVVDSKFYPVKFTDVANANKIRLQMQLIYVNLYCQNLILIKKKIKLNYLNFCINHMQMK